LIEESAQHTEPRGSKTDAEIKKIERKILQVQKKGRFSIANSFEDF
jgi:tRNA G26 N,N-dimethylase Trm1